MNDSLGKKPNAVVLLSGGLDSSTVLAMAAEQGFAPYALSFQYGQRHAHELLAAETVARKLHAVKHVVANIDLREFGGSALTADIAVPKGRSAQRGGEQTQGQGRGGVLHDEMDWECRAPRR